MPQGKGTYGSQVGRPAAKKKGVGAKKKRGVNAKNKSIMNTPVKKIPRALVKKTKQKVKNVLNNTPKQNIKKAGNMIKNKAKRLARLSMGGVGAGIMAGRAMNKRKK